MGYECINFINKKVNIWDRRTGDVMHSIFGPKISGDGVDIQDNLILTAANRGL